MRVALLQWTSGGLSGGSRKYLQEMLPRLSAQKNISGLQAWVPARYVEQMENYLPGRVHPLPAELSRCGVAAPATLRSWPFLKWADVVFLPCMRTLADCPVPQVVMFRNMEPPLGPFWSNPWIETLRNWLRNHAARRACRKACGIVAVSEYVRRFLVERWAVDESKITRIYHGVSATPGKAPASPPNFTDQPFILAAGSIRPARGLGDLLAACGRLKRRGLVLPLAVAGAVDRGMDSYFRRLVATAHQWKIASSVHWLGNVPSDELAWWMSQCRVFAVTSRAEACPNTVLEAMAAGCRIVSTTQEPMPEFLGDAADYYTPGDADQLANCIEAILRESAEARRHKCLLAKKQAQRFNWDATAQQTAAFLERVHKRRWCRVGSWSSVPPDSCPTGLSPVKKIPPAA
ncbi:MAG: mannosyltransferase [Pirellulaceae bacterium]|nr:MAG: mannosyltransferase [Pirellulaceae bacterium]